MVHTKVSDRSRFWQRIQGKLVLLLLFVLLPLLLIQGYTLYDGFQKDRSAELRANLELARAVAKAFENFVQDLLQQELSIGLALTSSQPPNDEDVRRILVESQAAHPVVAAFAWAEPKGTLIAASNPRFVGVDMSDRKHFQEIASGRDWTVSDLLISRAMGDPRFVVMRGIRNHQGELLGIVIANIVPDLLETVLKIERSKGGAVSLVDRNGMLVFRYPSIHPTWEQRNWIKDYPKYAEIFQGKEISESYFAPYEQKYRLIANVPVTSIGWVAGAGRTEEVAMAPITSQLVLQAILFLTVATVAFGAALLFSRFIADSVSRLRNQAIAFGSGNAQGTTVVSGPVEIQDLTRSFNEMAQRLTSRESTLREQREWLSVTLSSIGDAVIAADASGLVTFLNPVACALTGWEPADVIGRPVQSIFRVIDEETRQPADDVIARVLREECIVNLANHTALVTRDGREIPIEDSAAPIRNKEGGVCGAVLVFHDVTERRRAQERLASVARFPDENPNPVLRISGDGKLLYANRSSATLLKSLCCKVGETLPADWMRDALRTLYSGASEELELTCDDAVYSLMLVPISDLGYLNIYGRDITMRKLAESENERLNTAVRQERDTLSALISNIPDEIWFADAQKKFTLANPLALREFALDSDLALDIERFATSLEIFRADGSPRPIDEAPALRSLNGETIRNLEETIRIPASGKVVHRQVNSTPVKDVEGKIIGAVAVVRDITELKRAESLLTSDLAALTRMHALSGRLLETGGLQPLLQEIMEAAVVVAGAGMGTLQLLERDSLRIVASYGHQPPFIELFAAAENRASVCGEATRRGERVVVSDVETSPLFAGTPSLEILREAGVRAVQSTPMMSRNGALLGILTTQWGIPYTPDEHDLWRIDLLARQAADLIELSQAEEALRASRDELELRVQERTAELKGYMAKLELSNQALQDFASIASHDMQEPLRKVQSFGRMLRQQCGESLGQTGDDYLDRMLNATDRLQSLLTGLLEYSRVATTTESFREIHLSDLVSEVVSDLEARIVQTHGEVDVGDLPVISAVPTQMRQLFQNLIGNALKFHNPDRKPVVRVRSVAGTGTECRISVEDNGIGFDERYLDRIFSPFQRLHGRSEYEGTGMGLTICKKIVERHGGSITARSTPGAGTTFTVTLPLKRS